MRSWWTLFTNVFTVLGLSALLTAFVVWKLGWVDPADLVRAEAARSPGDSSQASRRSTRKNQTAGTKPRQTAKEVSGLQKAIWGKRLEGLCKEIEEREKNVKDGVAELRRRRKALNELYAVLYSFLSQFGGKGAQGGISPVSPEEFGRLNDPAKATEGFNELVEMVRKEIEDRRSRRNRLSDLQVVLSEMSPENAALLIGSSIEAQDAKEVLLKLDKRTRSRILDELVEENPSKAGKIFSM